MADPFNFSSNRSKKPRFAVIIEQFRNFDLLLADVLFLQSSRSSVQVGLFVPLFLVLADTVRPFPEFQMAIQAHLLTLT